MMGKHTRTMPHCIEEGKCGPRRRWHFHESQDFQNSQSTI